MSKKLLLADDSFVIQKLVGLSFANEAIEIVSTDNGDDAVSMAREIRPDVVLADIVMPGLSGYEVCEAIKQDPELAGTPVLLLTGTFEPFDDVRASSVGANGQITKPFEAQALIERVNEVIAEAAGAPLTPANSTAPSETPPTIEIEAEAIPSASETDESPFTPRASAPEYADLFRDGGGRLADETPSDETRFDLTPQLDPSEADFFGTPDEGAAEGLPPVASHLARASATPDATSDPFERPVSEEKPAEPLPRARSVELDAVSSKAGPAIPVATDDINATTFPNLGEPADEAPAGGFADLAIHVPSADIDHDRVTAPSSDVTEDTGFSSAALRDAAVADLYVSLEDEAPAVEEEPPARKDFGTPPPRDPFGVAATSESDATVVRDLEVADPLGLTPASVTDGSVDFAFDVSEQVAAAPPAPDLNDDSFSSMMDISESAPLGADDERPATPEIEADDPAETSVAGFDVSSSDLATAPRAEDEGTPAIEPSSELEPILEEPELPDAYGSIAKENPTRRSIMGDADLFDDLTTGSPLDELPPISAEATDLAFGSGEPLDVDDDLLESDLSLPLDDDLEDEFAIPLSPALEPEPDADARVADLSPMAEQRIQETLEKVAWEAFSDLSETIVKQVIGRVEQIAWEVIPEMAETLVREEIRKMKGEQD